MALANGPRDSEIMETLRYLEQGLVVTIFFAKKSGTKKSQKPEKRTLKVKLETRQVVWIRAQGGRPEGTGNL